MNHSETQPVDLSVARRRMISRQLVPRGVTDPKVLEVMGRLPRHLFVDPGIAKQAYEDRPLSIGKKQTISQPYMVATMTQALGLQGKEKILEIGTGSGYQTAVLCELTGFVYSVDRLADLSNAARKRLYSLGYHNFELKIGDGSEGWSERAPFDAILVTAGAPEIPEPLKLQLKRGGRMVIPVGSLDSQELLRLKKTSKGFATERLTGCRFVRLIGSQGWNEK